MSSSSPPASPADATPMATPTASSKRSTWWSSVWKSSDQDVAVSSSSGGGLALLTETASSWWSSSEAATPTSPAAPVNLAAALDGGGADAGSRTSSPQKRQLWPDRDPVLIERSNLVNILKLVIKEVIDSSLKFDRQLDSDHIPLQHFFIVLEHVLRHGIRPKKGLLGPKKELWDLLQLVEKRHSEAVDITASVRDLPTVKTSMGRARAWLRLALMQKKLADYVRGLVEQRMMAAPSGSGSGSVGSVDILAEFYEPQALLRSEEAALVVGLLVSLNVLDCNLCVKEEQLDSQQGVIDFSLYLRSKKDVGNVNDDGDDDDDDGDNGEGQVKDRKSITAVLDQKNYIEELNRHLTATVTNLEAKVDSLTTTNALMKEDRAISKTSLARLQEENRLLQAENERLGIQVKVANTTSATASARAGKATSDATSLSSSSSTSESSALHQGSSSAELNQKLADSICQRDALQKELDLQMSMKAEMEMAMKLLEKDVHEKQDTIVSLRDQIEDIKTINLEMFTKLQECQKSLKHKSDLISRLEEKSTAMADTMQKLDEKYVACESEKADLKLQLTSARADLEGQAEAGEAVTSDLKIEREWRQQLQESSAQDKEQVARLSQENDFLRDVEKSYKTMKDEHASLVHQVREHEETLEELGTQLSKTKLESEGLKERLGLASGSGADEGYAIWQEDAQIAECQRCDKEFNLSRRKHHCRSCGKIFCDSCSDNKMHLPSSAKPVRVCDTCYDNLMERYSKAK